MSIIRYYAGGVNKAEQHDDTTQTYTAWDEAGNITATRPYTQAESARSAVLAAQDSAQTNGETLRGKIQAALVANAAFLAIGSPTNAQVIAQTQRLTREMNAIIRLTQNLLDDTTGT